MLQNFVFSPTNFTRCCSFLSDSEKILAKLCVESVWTESMVHWKDSTLFLNRLPVLQMAFFFEAATWRRFIQAESTNYFSCASIKSFYYAAKSEVRVIQWPKLHRKRIWIVYMNCCNWKQACGKGANGWPECPNAHGFG